MKEDELRGIRKGALYSGNSSVSKLGNGKSIPVQIGVGLGMEKPWDGRDTAL